MKCTICNKDFISRRSFSQHLTRTHSDYFITDIYKELFIINTLFTKDQIDEVLLGYKNEEYPITSLPIDIVKYITLLGIKRTPSEEKKTLRYKEKYISTVQERYGVDNVSKLESIKEKKFKTFVSNFNSEAEAIEHKCNELNRGFLMYTADKTKIQEAVDKHKETIKAIYNVDNISKIPSVRNKNSVKSKEYMETLTFEQRQAITLNARKAVVARGGGVSKPEKFVRKVLKEAGYEFTTNQFVAGFNFDIVLPDKTIIEVNGDMWHANPLYYSADDLIMNKLKASDLWDKDLRKKTKVEELGYTVVYIWENETKTTEDLLLKLIHKRISNEKISNNTESGSNISN